MGVRVQALEWRRDISMIFFKSLKDLLHKVLTRKINYY
jgi:hypothetical protein